MIIGMGQTIGSPIVGTRTDAKTPVFTLSDSQWNGLSSQDQSNIFAGMGIDSTFNAVSSGNWAAGGITGTQFASLPDATQMAILSAVGFGPNAQSIFDSLTASQISSLNPAIQSAYAADITASLTGIIGYTTTNAGGAVITSSQVLPTVPAAPAPPLTSGTPGATVGPGQTVGPVAISAPVTTGGGGGGGGGGAGAPAPSPCAWYQGAISVGSQTTCSTSYVAIGAAAGAAVLLLYLFMKRN